MMMNSGVDSYGRALAVSSAAGGGADNFGTHRWTVYEGNTSATTKPIANNREGGGSSSTIASATGATGIAAVSSEVSFGHLHPLYSHSGGGGDTSLPTKRSRASGVEQNRIPRAPHHLSGGTQSSPSARGRRAPDLNPEQQEEGGRAVGGALRGVTVSPMSSGRLIGGIAYDTSKTSFKILPAEIATQGQQHAFVRPKGAPSPRGHSEEKSALFLQSFGGTVTKLRYSKGSGHEAKVFFAPQKTSNPSVVPHSAPSRQKGGGEGVREEHDLRNAGRPTRNTSAHHKENGEKTSAHPSASSSAPPSSFLSHVFEGRGAGLGEGYEADLRSPLRKNVRSKFFGGPRRHRDVLPDGASSASHYVKLRALAEELERQRKGTADDGQQRETSSVPSPTRPDKVLPASPASPLPHVPTRPTTSNNVDLTNVSKRSTGLCKMRSGPPIFGQGVHVDSIVSSAPPPSTYANGNAATVSTREDKRQRGFNFYYVVEHPEHEATPPLRQGLESVARIRNSPNDTPTLLIASDGEGKSSRIEQQTIYSHVKKTNNAASTTTAGAIPTAGTVVPLGTPSLVALNAVLRESYSKLCVAEAQERATAAEAFAKELRLLEDHEAAIAYLDDINVLLAGTESRRLEAKFLSELEAVSGEKEESERISIIIREERVRATLLRLFRQGHAAALLVEKVTELTALEDARRFKFTELEAKNRRIILKQVAEEVLYVRSVNPFGGHCPFFRGDDCPFSGDKGAHGQAVSREHFRQLPQELERRMRGIVESPEGVRARAIDAARISRASQFGEYLESRERSSAQHERELQQHQEKKRRNTQHLQGLHAAMENEASAEEEGDKEAKCLPVSTHDFKDEGTLAYEADKERNDSSVPIFVREVKHYNLLMKSLDADVEASQNIDSTKDSLRRLLLKPT